MRVKNGTATTPRRRGGAPAGRALAVAFPDLADRDAPNRDRRGAPARPRRTVTSIIILYTHADTRVRLGPQRGQAVKTARH